MRVARNQEVFFHVSILVLHKKNWSSRHFEIQIKLFGCNAFLQPLRWKMQIQDDANIPLHEAEHLARNRPEWGRFSKEAKGHQS